MTASNAVRYVQLPALGSHYFVGSDGSIHRLVELKPSVNQKGYEMVQLFDTEGKKYYATVHSIVALCFIGPRPPGLVINHKDGCKVNNEDSNLEYVTQSENTKHAFRLGLRDIPYKLLRKLSFERRGKRTKNRKFSDDEARQIIEEYASGEFAMKELGEKHGCSASSVHRVVHGNIVYQDIKKNRAPSILEKESRV